MWHSLRNLWKSASAKTRRHAIRPRSRRLTLEQLEDRLTPSNYTAANVTQLIADINAANLAGGANTIALTAPTNAPYTLAGVDNTTDGANGLPVIAANDNLTILGNGDVIARSSASGTPAFRLLDVTSGASLNLANLTLQGGLAYGSGVSAEGGGIYNQGTLDLNGVTVQNNIAQGGLSFNNGTSAYGGGVYVAGGAVNLTNDSLLSNIAVGGNGGKVRGIGGYGLGGALYVAGGTVTLTGDTLSSNTARGGDAGSIFGTGGHGLGGALYVAGGTVTLTSDILSSNTARGFAILGPGYDGAGGALYVGSGTVTLANDILFSNSAYGGRQYGGALYVGGGTVILSSDTISSNAAQGRSFGGGGAIYAAGGTITLRDDTITGNTAIGSRFPGEGGGLFIASAATLYLDDFTLAHTINNTASTSNNDIFGSYILIP